MPLYTLTHRHDYEGFLDQIHFYSKSKIDELPDVETLAKIFEIHFEPEKNEQLEIDFMDTEVVILDENWQKQGSKSVTSAELFIQISTEEFYNVN